MARVSTRCSRRRARVILAVQHAHAAKAAPAMRPCARSSACWVRPGQNLFMPERAGLSEKHETGVGQFWLMLVKLLCRSICPAMLPLETKFVKVQPKSISIMEADLGNERQAVHQVQDIRIACPKKDAREKGLGLIPICMTSASCPTSFLPKQLKSASLLQIHSEVVEHR